MIFFLTVYTCTLNALNGSLAGFAGRRYCSLLLVPDVDRCGVVLEMRGVGVALHVLMVWLCFYYVRCRHVSQGSSSSSGGEKTYHTSRSTYFYFTCGLFKYELRKMMITICRRVFFVGANSNDKSWAI